MFEETYASVTTNVAGREIKLETGKIARQATASIICLLYTSPSPRD